MRSSSLIPRSPVRQHLWRTALLSVLGILTLLLAAPSAHASQYCYGCVLNPAQEVPPTASTAVGGGQFLIDTDANTVTYHIVYNGLMGPETAAHFHGPAAPGVNAGVAVGLPLGNPKVGVWTYPEASEADLLAGKFYANVHSSVFPGGEIRGQIVPLNAQLNSAQETPPNASTGTGWAVFSIDTAANMLSYYIVYSGLTGPETASHIHGVALHGTAAGVIFGLPAGTTKIGVWNYPEADETALLTGMTYVNIHTAANPGGEIRGQIVPIVVPMDGAQEVPPNGSPAIGIGLIAYNDAANMLSYDIRYAGLTGAETAAHIHGFAAPGVNAPVLIALPAGTPKLGTWAYGAASQQDLYNGLTYANVHSTLFPGGEIRGQIQCFLNAPSSSVPQPGAPYAFRLDASQPNPFTSETRIGYRLDDAMPAHLSVFDAQGRHVRDLATGYQNAGDHTSSWDGLDNAGRQVASGVYWYVLETPQGKITHSMNLIR